jgi:G3E family GTPase
MLPTIVIGGYLGAGKTTLVNHLLREAGGRRIAVLVNDFGEIAIDADLIESRDGDVLNLAGGCVCCSVGSDLIGALLDLPARAQAPDVVLIETSGVALPGSVARGARLAPGIDVEGVVVRVDAETIQERAADRYVGDTVLQQLRDADLMIVNKLDLVDADRLDGLRRWLAERAPAARVIETVSASVPAEVVLGLHVEQRPSPDATPALFGAGGPQRIVPPPRAAGESFDSASFSLPHPVDARALAAALAGPDTGVVRAKGIVRDRDGAWVTVQVVGRRCAVSTAPARVAGAPPPSDGRLVCIGLREQFDRDALRRIVAATPASS